MMILRIFFLMLMLVGALQGQSNRNEKDQSKKLKFATSSTGGFRNLGNSIKQIIEKYCDLKNYHYDEIKIVADSSSGSARNLKDLRKGEVKLALFNSHALSSADSVDTIRLLLKLTPQYLHVLVNKSLMGKIDSLKHIMLPNKPRRQIGIGTRESGTYKFLHDYFFEDSIATIRGKKSFEDQTTKFWGTKSIGASLLVDAIPSAYVSKIKFDKTFVMLDADSTLFSIPEDTTKRSTFESAEIPPNTYKGLDRAVNTIKVYTLLAVHSSVETDLVVEIVKAIMTHPDELYGLSEKGSTGHPAADDIDVLDMLKTEVYRPRNKNDEIDASMKKLESDMDGRIKIACGPLSSLRFKVGRRLANRLNNSLPWWDSWRDSWWNSWAPRPRFLAINTSGSLDNLELLKTKDVQYAILQNDVALEYGLGESAQVRAAKFEIASIAMLGDEIVQIIVTRDIDSSFVLFKNGFSLDTTLLKGKTININDPGDATRKFLTEFFRQFQPDSSGLELEDLLEKKGLQTIELPYYSTYRLFQEPGVVDIAFFIIDSPSPIVRGILSRGKNLRLYSLPPPLVERLQQLMPAFERVTIPAGTYTNDTTIVTVKVSTVLVTRADIGKSYVGHFTRTLLEQNELITGDLNFRPRIPNEQNVTVPLHPGAADYYRAEKSKSILHKIHPVLKTELIEVMGSAMAIVVAIFTIVKFFLKKDGLDHHRDRRSPSPSRRQRSRYLLHRLHGEPTHFVRNKSKSKLKEKK